MSARSIRRNGSGLRADIATTGFAGSVIETSERDGTGRADLLAGTIREPV